VIRVGKFHNRVKDKLDEWIYFFKNAEIKSGFTARGLKEVGERLDMIKLNEKDAKAYDRYLKNLMDIASDQHSKMADAQELINKGKEERDVEIVLRLHNKGKKPDEISDLTGLPLQRVNQIIENQSDK